VDHLAPTVVAQLEAALHPSFASLLLRASTDTVFRPLASAPAGAAPSPLPGEWKVLALARLLARPLVCGIDRDEGVTSQLPLQEREYLSDTRVEVLVLVAASGNRDELVIALGPRRSEEPYSGEDLDLLAGVADALTLALQRPTPAVEPGPWLEECPACGRCYDTGARVCPHDASTLAGSPTERLLAGRYHLDQRLGHGGMGRVYRALDVALNRTVAVKLLREEWTRLPHAADRFRREARVAASFAHANVVTVFDFGLTDGGCAFLVMELLEGGTLREDLRQNGRLRPQRTLEILRSVCAAVGAAHRRQLVHRDLKPENIFLARSDSGEVVKILDFGLARSVSSATDDDGSSAVLAGTPPYMAPEQLRAGETLPVWDLWALGVLSYELLTGTLPFAAAVRPAAPVSPSPGSTASTRWPDPMEDGLRDDLETARPFFARALAIDAAVRYSSAETFFAALQEAVQAIEASPAALA